MQETVLRAMLEASPLGIFLGDTQGKMFVYLPIRNAAKSWD